MDTAELPIAALVHEHGDGADALMRAFVERQSHAGLDVRGLVTEPGAVGAPRSRRGLRDVRTGEIFHIFQDLGAGSQACCLDVFRLAAASAALRPAGDGRPDLVVVSRYGRQEAGGGGFAAEFLALMAEGVPVLTIVAGEFLEDWRRFTGGLGVELPVDADRLHAWGARVCRAGVIVGVAG
ncbi:DUF2478 domain-containing protein [Castellaniella hirudinis]|uniref:DUF2478 domain-containing protein n=1 Tax=Castellaniella hirudinis TaxID=1144617 RepID=A0ABV8RWX9_9BURK